MFELQKTGGKAKFIQKIDKLEGTSKGFDGDKSIT